MFWEQFGKRIVIGYYRNMMFTNLYGYQSLEKRYGESVMSGSFKAFQTYAVHIYGVKDSNGKSCNAWVVLALFNPHPFVNEPRYLERDRSPRMAREANRRKESLEFVQTIGQDSSYHLKRRDVMCVGTLRNIARSEELFVEYGTPYHFVCKLRPRPTKTIKKTKKHASLHFSSSLGKRMCRMSASQWV